MSERFRYARTPIGTRRSVHLRRFKDPVQHDKYYAFLKHQSQARYRQEPYALTWAQWQRVWPAELWHRRGRAPHSLRLIRVNPNKSWHEKNCAVVQHDTHMSLITLARLHAKRQTVI